MTCANISWENLSWENISLKKHCTCESLSWESFHGPITGPTNFDYIRVSKCTGPITGPTNFDYIRASSCKLEVHWAPCWSQQQVRKKKHEPTPSCILSHLDFSSQLVDIHSILSIKEVLPEIQSLSFGLGVLVIDFLNQVSMMEALPLGHCYPQLLFVAILGTNVALVCAKGCKELYFTFLFSRIFGNMLLLIACRPFQT